MSRGWASVVPGAVLCALLPVLTGAQTPMPPARPVPAEPGQAAPAPALPAATGGSGGFVRSGEAPAGPAASGRAPHQPVVADPGWGDGPVNAAAAARLFEDACLATLPDFAGAGAHFDALGFVGAPGMRIRNHPERSVSALAMTEADLDASGIRSCAVLVNGLAQPSAAQAVEPIVRTRFAGARRFDGPESGPDHVIWMVATPAGPARIAVTESGDAAFIGATVIPAAPAASARGG